MTMAHTKGGERRPQPADTFLELAIGETPLVRVDDLLVGRASDPRQQQLTDGQGICMRARNSCGGVTGHVECLSFAVRRSRGTARRASRQAGEAMAEKPRRLKRERRSRGEFQIMSGPMDA